MAGSSSNGNAMSQQLKESDVFKYFSEVYPSFIIFIGREEEKIEHVKLPYGFIVGCPERIPKNIILQLPNGHETHVHFRKSDKSLFHMTNFVKECQGLFGSIMVLSYKGNGKFVVNCLKDDLGEVIYFMNRTIPRGPVFDQDLDNGLGWKFLVFLNDPAIVMGEIPIPPSFWRMFGKGLPPIVSFIMRNGSVYQGTCSTTVRKMLGLSDLIATNAFTENEKLLFTYIGQGKFFIMIFDIADVEKRLMPDSDSSDSEDESSEVGLDNIQENVEDNVVDEVAGLNNGEIENAGLHFRSVMTVCNINNSCHGPYIPRYISPANRGFMAGDEVILRTTTGDWNVMTVISNNLPRFSSGWNKFARDNHVLLHETLIFNLVEEDYGIVFLVEFPARN